MRFLRGLVRAVRRPVPEARLVPAQPPNPAAERAVAVCLLFAGCAFVGFVAVYLEGADTQYLGLALGLGLALLGVALALASRTIVAQETVVEPREVVPAHEEDEVEAVVLVEEGVDRISRRRLLTASGGAAAFALLAALVVPLGSLGPFTGARRLLLETPWRRGRRLVGEDGRPIAAADVSLGSFLTAFPEGVDRERFDGPLIVVRLPRAQLRLPDELQGFDADGILAFSKICPHAGCAISMYRRPLFPDVEPKPALVCPCHYSTFDVAAGGKVTFGPAGRALPMLPIAIDRAGDLRARGGFPRGVGPSWWGVREKGRDA